MTYIHISNTRPYALFSIVLWCWKWVETEKDECELCPTDQLYSVLARWCETQMQTVFFLFFFVCMLMWNMNARKNYKPPLQCLHADVKYYHKLCLTDHLCTLFACSGETQIWAVPRIDVHGRHKCELDHLCTLLCLTDHLYTVLCLTDHLCPLLCLTDHLYTVLCLTDHLCTLLCLTDHLYTLLCLTDNLYTLLCLTDNLYTLLCLTDNLHTLLACWCQTWMWTVPYRPLPYSFCMFMRDMNVSCVSPSPSTETQISWSIDDMASIL